MVNWEVILSSQAVKDAKKISRSGLKAKAQRLLELLELNPYSTPPPFKRLKGNLSGTLSRRITIKHRLVYQVDDEHRKVHVLSMWSHNESL